MQIMTVELYCLFLIVVLLPNSYNVLKNHFIALYDKMKGSLRKDKQFLL